MHPAVPSRMKKMFPHARLVVMLRDPVSRVKSHIDMFYGRKLGKGIHLKDASVDGWLTSEERLLKQCDAAHNWYGSNPATAAQPTVKDPQKEGHGTSHCIYADDFLLRYSMYETSFERWMHFFPREQILFLRQEDMSVATRDVVARVVAHLGLDPSFEFPADVIDHRSRPDVPEELRHVHYNVTESQMQRITAAVGSSTQWLNDNFPRQYNSNGERIRL